MRVAWHPLFALKNCNLTNLSASQRQKNQGNFMLYFENTARDITVSKLVRCRLCVDQRIWVFNPLLLVCHISKHARVILTLILECLTM